MHREAILRQFTFVDATIGAFDRGAACLQLQVARGEKKSKMMYFDILSSNFLLKTLNSLTFEGETELY